MSSGSRVEPPGAPTGSTTGPPAGATPPAPPTDLRRRAALGVLWTAAQKWSVRFSTLVAFIVLGRLLEPAEFGVVALAMTFVTILTMVSEAGFATYLLQLRALTDRTASTAFFIATGTGLVLAVALAATARPIGDALDAPALAQLLPALAVTLLLNGAGSVPAALLTREMRFKALAVRQVTATALSVVVAIALAVAGAGVWALVAQTLVRTVVSQVALWTATDFRPRLLFSRTEAREMVVFGSKSLGVRVTASLRNQGENFVIGALAGISMLGLWVVGGRVVSVLVDLCSAVVQVVTRPVLARLQDDPERLARAYGASAALGTAVLAPVLVVTAFTSPFLVPAVFGQQWVPAAGLAAVLAVRAIATGIVALQRGLLESVGRVGAELAVSVGVLVADLAAVVLLARGDLVVLAWVSTGIAAVSLVVRAAVTRRVAGVPWSASGLTARVLAAAGLMAGALALATSQLEVSGWGLVALAAGAGGAVYAVAVLLLARPVLTEGLRTARSLRSRRG